MKKIALQTEAKIEIKQPITTFSSPDVIEEFIDVLQGAVRFAKQGQTVGYLYAPFNALRKTLPNAFTLKQIYVLRMLSLSDFKEAYYDGGVVVSVPANMAGNAYTSADFKEMVRHVNMVFPQDKKGNIFVIARLTDVPGISFAELKSFLPKFYEEVLKLTAKKADLLAECDAAVKEFLSTNFHEDSAFYLSDKPARFGLKNLNPNLAFIDFNQQSSGEAYTVRELDKLLVNVESGYALHTPKTEKPAEDTPAKPKGFDLQTLKGKHVVMIGLPPKGYSTAKFQSELKHLGCTVEAKFQLSTKVAFYNPDQTTGDKIKRAQTLGITMVPYQDVIKAILEN